MLEAHDGAAALRLLEREPSIDLLFTDVVMPGKCRAAQLADEARSIRPGCKMLYTTGYTRNAIVHGGRLDPGVHLITKPFTYQAWPRKSPMSSTSGAPAACWSRTGTRRAGRWPPNGWKVRVLASIWRQLRSRP